METHAWNDVYLQCLIFFIVFTKTDGTCNSDQYYSCQKAAVDDRISTLPGGGLCQAKSYIQYTHVCSVKNYIPGVDYCCCSIDSVVLCCRYHQDWNHFRCAEAEDRVDTFPPRLLPVELLLAAIFGPVVLLACCIVCCIKCCCYRYEGDAQPWCCQYCREDSREFADEKPVKKRGIFSEDDIGVPLTLDGTSGYDRSATELSRYIYHPPTYPWQHGQQGDSPSEWHLLGYVAGNDANLDPSATGVGDLMDPEEFSSYVSFDNNSLYGRDEGLSEYDGSARCSRFLYHQRASLYRKPSSGYCGRMCCSARAQNYRMCGARLPVFVCAPLPTAHVQNFEPSTCGNGTRGMPLKPADHVTLSTGSNGSPLPVVNCSDVTRRPLEPRPPCVDMDGQPVGFKDKNISDLL